MGLRWATRTQTRSYSLIWWTEEDTINDFWLQRRGLQRYWGTVEVLGLKIYLRCVLHWGIDWGHSQCVSKILYGNDWNKKIKHLSSFWLENKKISLNTRKYSDMQTPRITAMPNATHFITSQIVTFMGEDAWKFSNNHELQFLTSSTSFVRGSLFSKTSRFYRQGRNVKTVERRWCWSWPSGYWPVNIVLNTISTTCP